MERSKRSLNTRMKHGDDDGVNEDSNLSRLEPDRGGASIKEDRQRTTTQTDNKKRDYENEGSSMHEDSCIGINCAHMFTKCFRSLHTLLGFALYFVSSILIVVAENIYSILTCSRIPCNDSPLRKRVFRGVVFTPRVGCSRPPSACKRSNCNKIENNKNKFVKVVRLRFYPKTEHNGVPFYHIALHASSFIDFL